MARGGKANVLLMNNKVMIEYLAFHYGKQISWFNPAKL